MSSGQDQWRSRFLQLRRNTGPLEERMKDLENQEEDVQENLLRLFELRKPMRYGIYGEHRQVPTIQADSHSTANSLLQLPDNFSLMS